MIARESISKIEFRKVSIGHGKKNFLKNCTFHFPTNMNCRILFQNDVQKFFFFNSLSALKGFSAGKFLLNGQNVLDYSFEEYLKFRKNIGYGFSTRGLMHNRSLKQNVLLPLAYHQEMEPTEADTWVEYLFEYFGATDDMNSRPSEVVPSAQKVALLLRAFVMRPQWLILDCPEIFLDRRLHANLLQLIEDHRKNYGLQHLLYSTTDEDLSTCLADATIIVEKEQIRVLNALSRKFEAVA